MFDIKSFDPLLADNFFIAAAVNNENNKIAFTLPTSAGELTTFLAGAEGETYRNEVKQLSERLKMWASKNDITFSNEFDEFNDKFNYTGDNLHFCQQIYPLLSDGVILLNNIVNKLESSDYPITTKSVISNLIQGLDVCEPGIFTHLSNAFLQLSSDPKIELMGIRKELAENTVLEMIRTFKKSNPTYFISDGMEIHHSNTVLNHYSKELGINHIKDSFTESDDEHLTKVLIDKFPQELSAFLTTKNVIEKILIGLYLEDLVTKPSYAAQLEKRLNGYGQDDLFNLNQLYDQDALADDEFKLAHNAYDIVKLSLLQRLISSKLLQNDKMIIKDNNGDTLCLAPREEIGLSYVITKKYNQKIPLVDYILESYSESNTALLNSLSSQSGRLETAIIEKIISDERRLFSDDYQKNITDDIKTKQQDWITHFKATLKSNNFNFNELWCDNAAILKLIKYLPAEEKEAILSWFPYTRLIRTQTELAQFITSLSPTEWGKIKSNLIKISEKVNPTLTEFIKTAGDLPSDTANKWINFVDVEYLNAITLNSIPSTTLVNTLSSIQKESLENIITAIANKGVDLSIPTEYGVTLLHFLCMESNTPIATSNIDLIKILIKAGANVNSVNNDGENPLHYAISSLSSNSINIIKTLIASGADIKKTDDNGTTFINQAATRDDILDIINVLVEAKVDLNTPDDHGLTLLHYASLNNNLAPNVDAIKVLIDAAKDINKPDNNGRTPLYFAVSNKNNKSIATIELLLKAGADINRPDNTGVSPFDIVSKSKNDDLRELFQQYQIRVSALGLFKPSKENVSADELSSSNKHGLKK